MRTSNLHSSYLDTAKARGELKRFCTDELSADAELFAVTLTFKPSLRLKMVERSKDIRCFLNRLNTKLYGKAFRHGKRKVECVPIFELNSSGGVHVHMIVRMQHGSTRLSKPFKDVVVDTWLELDCAGVKQAQDVRSCYNLSEWIGYISKDLTTRAAFDRIDWANACMNAS